MLPSSSSITPSTDEFPWYALKVRARSEPVAVAALSSRGYRPFAPTVAERRRYCDRTSTVHVPVFPGYLFCRLDASRRVPVLSCPAVEYIVSFDGAPAVVPDNEIESVRIALDQGAWPRSYLAAGRPVRIQYGPLAGVEGILERTGKGHQVVVSVHLLQRSVAIKIDSALVRPV